MSTTPRALATAAALLVGIAALGDLHARHAPIVAVALPADALTPLDDGSLDDGSSDAGSQELVALDPFAGGALWPAPTPGTRITEVTTTSDGGHSCTTRVEEVAGRPATLVRRVSGDGCATATPPRRAARSVPADTI